VTTTFGIDPSAGASASASRRASGATSGAVTMTLPVESANAPLRGSIEAGRGTIVTLCAAATVDRPGSIVSAAPTDHRMADGYHVTGLAEKARTPFVTEPVER
jgi:hypothetical protein